MSAFGHTENTVSVKTSKNAIASRRKKQSRMVTTLSDPMSRKFIEEYSSSVKGKYKSGIAVRSVSAPRSIVERVNDARCLLECGDARGAIAECNVVLGEYEGSGPAITNTRKILADALLSIGDWRRAVDEYTSVLKSDPMSSSCYWGRGECLQALGDSVGAFREFEKYEKLSPCEPDRIMRIASCALDAGILDVTLSRLNGMKVSRKKDIREICKSAVYLFLLGKVHALSGEESLAEQAFLESRTADPHYYETIVNEARKFEDDWKRADDSYSWASRLIPNDVDLLVEWGRMLSKAEQHNKAAIILTNAAQCCEEKELQTEIWIETATVHRSAGDLEKSAAAYENAEKAAEEANNEQLLTYSLLQHGVLLLLLGKRESSLELIKRIPRSESGDPSPWWYTSVVATDSSEKVSTARSAFSCGLKLEMPVTVASLPKATEDILSALKCESNEMIESLLLASLDILESHPDPGKVVVEEGEEVNDDDVDQWISIPVLTELCLQKIAKESEDFPEFRSKIDERAKRHDEQKTRAMELFGQRKKKKGKK